MPGDEVEIRAVRLRDPGQADVAARKIDAAVAAQPASCRLCLRYLDIDLVVGDFPYDATDLAVVQRNRVARGQVFRNLERTA